MSAEKQKILIAEIEKYSEANEHSDKTKFDDLQILQPVYSAMEEYAKQSKQEEVNCRDRTMLKHAFFSGCEAKEKCMNLDGLTDKTTLHKMADEFVRNYKHNQFGQPKQEEVKLQPQEKVDELPDIYYPPYNKQRIKKYTKLLEEYSIDKETAREVFCKGADWYKELIKANTLQDNRQ